MATETGPVYFWHAEGENGHFGQWYESPWEHEGVVYRTAEMWMMVQKAKLFGDETIASKMAATTSPKQHKSLGRKVANFNGKTWDEHKLRIVEEGNYHKFTKSKDAANLKKLLLDTGDRELVEASPLDRIWGIGYTAENAGANREFWGENLLGKALMSVRERVRREKEAGKVEGK